jgi:hypothetical protein
MIRNKYLAGYRYLFLKLSLENAYHQCCGAASILCGSCADPTVKQANIFISKKFNLRVEAILT